MRQILKRLLAHTPYRIVRAHALNRFSAIPEVLTALKSRGFSPTHIIDGGANIGDFAREAASIYPAIPIEMIEPQPACHEALRKLAAQQRFVLHPVALASPAKAGKTLMLSTPGDEVSTGAHISSINDASAIEVPSATLDQILAQRLSMGDARMLLKLDLQGYELEALTGGESTLRQTEVILTEVSFFAQAYEPQIATLVAWLDEREFALYDIAALSERTRDGRARQGDFVFVRRSSALARDAGWD